MSMKTKTLAATLALAGAVLAAPTLAAADDLVSVDPIAVTVGGVIRTSDTPQSATPGASAAPELPVVYEDASQG